MFSRTVCSSTAPTVAQKYPLAHRCGPQIFSRRCGNSSCSRLDDLPCTYCASFDGASCGGAATSMCTWSADTVPRTICTSRI